MAVAVELYMHGMVGVNPTRFRTEIRCIGSAKSAWARVVTRTT